MNSAYNVLTGVTNWFLDQYYNGSFASAALGDCYDDDSAADPDVHQATITSEAQQDNEYSGVLLIDDSVMNSSHDDLELDLGSLIENDWVFVTHYDLYPVASHQATGSNNISPASTRCNSQNDWVVTPPSCFTRAECPRNDHFGRRPFLHRQQDHIEAVADCDLNQVSIMENLLIEHPSLSLFEKFPERFGHVIKTGWPVSAAEAKSEVNDLSPCKVEANEWKVALEQNNVNKENDFYAYGSGSSSACIKQRRNISLSASSVCKATKSQNANYCKVRRGHHQKFIHPAIRQVYNNEKGVGALIRSTYSHLL